MNFSQGFLIFRKDRTDGYGGVLLACRDTINCQEVIFDTNAEATVSNITLEHYGTLIICSFY